MILLKSTFENYKYLYLFFVLVLARPQHNPSSDEIMEEKTNDFVVRKKNERLKKKMLLFYHLLSLMDCDFYQGEGTMTHRNISVISLLENNW